jgi:glycyl-tRNA synthetase
LTAHSKATNQKLVVRETLPEPIVRDRLVLEVTKQKLGPAFRGNAKHVVGYFNTLLAEGSSTEAGEEDWDEAKLTELQKKLEAGNGSVEIEGTDGNKYTITKDMVKVIRRTDKINSK